MADGTNSTERFAPGGKRFPIRLRPVSADTKKDKEKLASARAGQMSMQGLVNVANRIHDIGMRDAALGRIIKNRIRSVEESPRLMNELSYQRSDLLEIVDMMHDDAKRDAMTKRVKSMGKGA